MLKIFTLKTIDPASGVVQKATFREKLAWLIAGRPLRKAKVVHRFLEKRHKAELKAHCYGSVKAHSNTFSLPST